MWKFKTLIILARAENFGLICDRCNSMEEIIQIKKQKCYLCSELQFGLHIYYHKRSYCKEANKSHCHLCKNNCYVIFAKLYQSSLLFKVRTYPCIWTDKGDFWEIFDNIFRQKTNNKVTKS